MGYILAVLIPLAGFIIGVTQVSRFPHWCTYWVERSRPNKRGLESRRQQICTRLALRCPDAPELPICSGEMPDVRMRERDLDPITEHAYDLHSRHKPSAASTTAPPLSADPRLGAAL